MSLLINAALAHVIVLGVAVLGTAALPPRTRAAVLRNLARLAWRHRAAAVAATAAAVIVARLCCLPVLPRPTPVVPDEYSHLLLAHTLASGRLANPPHPMWRHFETLFVLQRPSYASVYPPMQGSMLTIGLVATGDAWFGVLLSVALMCGAVVWMLRAYVTPFWALYGGVLATVGYGVLSYWVNSYWGGAPAAFGGAIVFGAVGRMAFKPRVANSVALGVGLIVLANSRPYEGFLVSLPIAVWLLRILGRRAVDRRALARRHALALASVLLVGAISMGWYNWRVTGSPFRLAYTAYIEQYASAPGFIWQSAKVAPQHGDRVLRDAHFALGIDYIEYSTAEGIFRKSIEKIVRVGAFYFGPFWAVVLLTLPATLRQPKLRLLLVALGFCMTGILLTAPFQVHYAAPCASVLVLLLVEGFRRIRRWWLAAGNVLILAAPMAWLAVQTPGIRSAQPESPIGSRPAILAKVASAPGRHILIVRYGLGHPLGQEWVYNEPDIDNSSVIWARDLGPDRNRELIRYYPQRNVWFLEPDKPGIHLFRLGEIGRSGAGKLQ